MNRTVDEYSIHGRFSYDVYNEKIRDWRNKMVRGKKFKKFRIETTSFIYGIGRNSIIEVSILYSYEL